MSDEMTTMQRIDDLRERSKDDNAARMIVGSEVRWLCGLAERGADPTTIIDAAWSADRREHTAATILAALIQGSATIAAAQDTANPHPLTSDEIARILVPSAVALTDALRAALKVSP